MTTSFSSPSSDQIKNFHHKFVTGVTAVTTLENTEPRGLIVNAFSSLSLDPPTIIVCIQKTSSCYPHLFARDHLGISILAENQKDVCNLLASSGENKFQTISWSPGPYESPVIDGAAAWMEAEITERIQASTHTMFIARVVAVNHSEHAPLLYAAGSFYDGSSLNPV